MAAKKQMAIDEPVGKMSITPLPDEDDEKLTPEEEASLEEGIEAPTEPGVADEVAAQEQGTGEEPEAPAKPPRKVPVGELIDERHKRQALEAQLKELNDKMTAQEERWNRANQRLAELQARSQQEAAQKQQQQVADQDPEPNKQDDPLAHYDWQNRQLQKQVAALQQQVVYGSQQSQGTQQMAAIQAAESQFAMSHPDYYDRVNFLRSKRDAELQMMGYGDPNERAQIIANEAGMIVTASIRSGRNPAETLFKLSDEWKYQAPAAAEAANGNGENKPTAREQVAELQRKEAAARSAQGLRARPAQAPLTLDDIASMDDEAYEEFVEKRGGDIERIFRS